MMKRISALPAIVLGTAVASLAFGQDDLFGLSVTAGAKFTDNRDAIDDGTLVNGVPEQKEDQWAYYIGPTLSFYREISDRMEFKAAYSPVYTWYDNAREGTEDKKWEHTVRANFLYKFSNTTSIKFNEDFWFTGQKSYFYGDDYSYDPSRDTRVNDDYYQNRFALAFSHFLTQDTYMSLSGRSRIKRYDEKEYADYCDEDEFGGRFDLMTVQSRFLTWGAFFDYTSWERKNDASKAAGNELKIGVDYFTAGLQASIDINGDKDSIVYASVGYNHASYDADDLDDQDMFGDSRLELRLFQQKDTQFLAGLRYGIDYSDVYPFSSQKDLASYASLTQYLGQDRKFRASASIEYRTRKYDLEDDLDPAAARYGYVKALQEAKDGGDYKRDSIYVRVAANYRFTDAFSAGAFYSFEDIDSDVGTSYSENIFGLNATYKFF